jgi:protein-tyrosine phosphatase
MTTTVLVVCTANVCRSPMAAALLGEHLRAAGSRTRAGSAGTRATVSAVAPEAVAVMADRGLDIAVHTPRLLARDDVRYADLVVAMECSHVAQVVSMDASAFGKTFCARELAARVEARGVRRADEEIDDCLARLHRGRRAVDIMRTAGELDIADPMGQPRESFERCAKELDDLMRVVAEVVR